MSGVDCGRIARNSKIGRFLVLFTYFYPFLGKLLITVGNIYKKRNKALAIFRIEISICVCYNNIENKDLRRVM